MASSAHQLRRLTLGLSTTAVLSWFAVGTGSLDGVCARCEEKRRIKSTKPTSSIIFLGTGSSTGCPKPLCTMLFNSVTTDAPTGSNPVLDELRGIFQDKCHVSRRAIIGDPINNKDYRNNPSLLICHYDEKDDRMKHIVIDVGKTFRETSLRWFPKYGISSLDAIILTHEHADASFGLDEVRGYQRMYPSPAPHTKPTSVPMKVFLSQQCLDVLSGMFPWLFPAQQKIKEVDPSKPVVDRFVSSLDLHVFEAFQAMDVEGLQVRTLPVMHGEDLVSYGFAFTVGKTNVVYLSDISRMLPETLDFIQNELPPTDILIVDALYATSTHPVHFSMESAIALMNEIKPGRTFFVGMNCDAFLPHVEMNEALRKEYGNAQLAHDGLRIEC